MTKSGREGRLVYLHSVDKKRQRREQQSVTKRKKEKKRACCCNVNQLQLSDSVCYCECKTRAKRGQLL